LNIIGPFGNLVAIWYRYIPSGNPGFGSEADVMPQRHVARALLISVKVIFLLKLKQKSWQQHRIVPLPRVESIALLTTKNQLAHNTFGLSF
jgi:hypothetical protein